ncbi:MAG: hypothetical protein LH606_05825 [Cytophagaceae bacterium]|nr:hypothetical protein [Cytophagaceae bacterium]
MAFRNRAVVISSEFHLRAVFFGQCDVGNEVVELRDGEVFARTIFENVGTESQILTTHPVVEFEGQGIFIGRVERVFIVFFAGNKKK